MANSIKVVPNQGLLDVILQACGTLEGGMQMMLANGRSISDYPDVGDTLHVNNQDAGKSDSGVLTYLQQNGIVIGTLSETGSLLSFEVVLKPEMHVVSTTSSPPSVTGAYQFKLAAASPFLNVYPIQHAHYPANDNFLYYITEERYIAGDTPDVNLTTGNYMDAESLPYNLAWVSGRGFMLAWIDLSAPAKTATFVDSMGNEAFVGPLIVFDNVSQNIEEYLIADILVELVSATRNTATLRLTKSHTPIGHIDFLDYVMNWLYDATGGTPDPLDPTNSDKTILTLIRGTYTFGVATFYTNGGTTYPPSAFSMVITIT